MKARPSKLDPFKQRLDEWFFLTDAPKTLAQARDELRKDGCSVSLDSLSRWHQRRKRERQNELVNDWTEDFEEECHRFHPGATQDQVRQFVIHFLIKKGMATGNDQLTLLAIDREQSEITGKTKAELERRKLDLGERRVKMLERKAAAFDDAKKVNADQSLTPEQKQQRYKQIFGMS